MLMSNWHAQFQSTALLLMAHKEWNRSVLQQWTVNPQKTPAVFYRWEKEPWWYSFWLLPPNMSCARPRRAIYPPSKWFEVVSCVLVRSMITFEKVTLQKSTISVGSVMLELALWHLQSCFFHSLIVFKSSRGNPCAYRVIVFIHLLLQWKVKLLFLVIASIFHWH